MVVQLLEARAGVFFLSMSAGTIVKPHRRQNNGAQTIQETLLPQPFKPEAATMISATECCDGGGGVYGGRISGVPKCGFVVLTMLRCIHVGTVPSPDSSKGRSNGDSKDGFQESKPIPTAHAASWLLQFLLAKRQLAN